MTFSATGLTPQIGTEIRSDRDTLLSGQHAPEIRRLLGERGVLIFRRLELYESGTTQV